MIELPWAVKQTWHHKKNRCLWNTLLLFPTYWEQARPLTFHLLTWILIDIIYSSRTYLPTTFEASSWANAFLSYQLHKVWETNIPFDLDLWPTDMNINRDHLLIKDYLPTKFEASGAKCYQLHKVWYTDKTFDLDLWSTDLNNHRDHLHIKDYLPTMFEASGAKHSWDISCTKLRDTDTLTYRLTHRPTDRHVQSNMPLLLWRGA